MNFFFHTHTTSFKSTLTIPKFQNSGTKSESLSLFSAEICNEKWMVCEASFQENSNFWIVTCEKKSQNVIYFIASSKNASLIQTRNEICELNTFTDTMPDFRANLMIENQAGGFSSYQSEYPFRMTTRLASLYSDCSTLTFERSTSVGVFIRNIYFEPIHKEIPLFLYDDLKKEVVEKFSVFTNKTTYIDLTKFRKQLSSCFLFAKNFMGVPIYVVEYSDGGISFEHTHPPHSSIGSDDRFQIVNNLKGKAIEKVS